MRWTIEQDNYLIAHFADTTNQELAAALSRTDKAIHARAVRLRLKKSAAYLEQVKEITRQTEFKKGHKTWNKGIHYIPGGRSAETRFKPGQQSKNHHPIGHERITSDGNTQRKLTDAIYEVKPRNQAITVTINTNGQRVVRHTLK
jgi:hypothetical protein